MKSFFVGMMLGFGFFSVSVQAQHTIIPAPVSYKAVQGSFLLSDAVAITATPELQALSDWFVTQIKHVGITISPNGRGGKIVLRLLPALDTAIGKEGYRLQITPAQISLSANEPRGIFYGMQTLLQMMPAYASGNAVAIPCADIADYPAFSWRGLMLDVSRHFFTVAEVKNYIDLMARYKLNVFHWHLTDDNGWRIEIKSYPKLATVGGCRVVRHGTFGQRIAPQPGEPATDCNYYTQEQIKDIVAYANARNITIVPEIDVPGHSLAAIAAYPELSITKQPQMVNPGSKFSEWYGDGTFKMLLDNTLNPADENVYIFLDKVFGEVAGLFPGTYLHAGGDECYHGYWEKSPEVQALMKKQGIKDMHGVQSYFMKRVAKIIESKGKKMIGWDEILDGGLAEGAAVMSWRGMKGGIAAAKAGHMVVMSPTTHAYLDYMQADPYWEPAVYEKLYLKTCYSFNPLPDGVDAKWIMGGQANLWTEKVPHYRHATYMTYPRAWAISEALWTPPAEKSWDNFALRTAVHFDRMEAVGINVCHAVYDPIVRGELQKGDTLLHIRCEFPGAIIRYTLDGTHPDRFSPIYEGPVKLPAGPVVLRVSTFLNDRPAGRVLVLSREEIAKRKSW